MSTLAENQANRAEPADPTKGSENHRLARKFLRDNYWHEPMQEYKLRFWNGHFWVWVDGYYSELDDEVLRAEISLELERALVNANSKAKVTRSRVADIREAIKALTIVAEKDMPVWLGRGKEKSLLVMKNGLINIGALLRGEDITVTSHNPLWFSPVALPYAYDPAALAPRWLAFLEQMLEGDAERIRLLHEWLGYLLSGDTSRQRFLILAGPPASGKSTVCNVITELLGPGNVSHQPLDIMFDRFQLVPTLGKLANITTEADYFNPKSQGSLKAFTAGERMSFERKKYDVFPALPTARLVCATNAVPAFGDRPGGIGRRMVLLPFNVSIPEGLRDSTLGEKLNAELAGIFNLAVEAYRAIELPKRREFTACEASRVALKDYERESQPERAFLEEACELVEGVELSKAELYSHYKDFCNENGHKPLDAAQFGKQVKRVFPEVGEVRRRDSVGARVRSWLGVKVTPQ